MNDVLRADETFVLKHDIKPVPDENRLKLPGEVLFGGKLTSTAIGIYATLAVYKFDYYAFNDKDKDRGIRELVKKGFLRYIDKEKNILEPTIKV
jgi:hypothetical protein